MVSNYGHIILHEKFYEEREKNTHTHTPKLKRQIHSFVDRKKMINLNIAVFISRCDIKETKKKLQTKKSYAKYRSSSTHSVGSQKQNVYRLFESFKCASRWRDLISFEILFLVLFSHCDSCTFRIVDSRKCSTIE